MRIKNPASGLFLIAGAALGTLIVALVAVWNLAYPSVTPPGSSQLSGLQGEVRVIWGASGDAAVHAPSTLAAASGLGYVHAWNHAWTMVLWRQAAQGRLADWFGNKAFPADALARGLGLAQLAEESQHNLSGEDLRHLAAYAAGASAALSHTSTASRPEFLILNHAPEPWLPWHTLAIERLIAYLASDVDCVAFQSFCRADSTLRAMVHLHGFSGSLAWVVGHDSTATLFQRHVFGSSALPAFQEVLSVVPGQSPVRGITLIGTPFFVGGQSRSGAWAALLRSSAELMHTAWDPVPALHVRLSGADGHEQIAAITRMPGMLRIEADSDTTAWVLSWPGLAPGSDTGAWRALAENRNTFFGLFTGARLHTDAHGQWHIVGKPAVKTDSPYGALISHDPKATHLPLPDMSWLRTRAWVADTYSTYAAAVLPRLLAKLDEAYANERSGLGTALAYLRNWDYRYDRSSIGASVFAAWMDAEAGVFSSNAERLGASLEEAVRTLSMRYGSDLSTWRWEQLHPDRRHFAIAHASRAATMPRFAPMEWPGEGCAAAPCWGAGHTSLEHASSAMIELWHTVLWQDDYAIRRRPMPAPGFLNRYRLLEHSTEVYTVPSRAERTTKLTR